MDQQETRVRLFDSFEAWDRAMAKESAAHPVRYFFRRTIPRKWGRFCRRLNDAWWWVQHRFNPRHRYNIVRTGLKPGYYEPETLILHACFELLKGFVEIQMNQVSWEEPPGMPEAKKEIDELYHWWTKVYPNREELDPYRDGCDEATLRASNEFDLEWEATEQRNLHRLIEIRGFLWT